MLKTISVLSIYFLIFSFADQSKNEGVDAMNSATQNMDQAIQKILEDFTRSYVEKTTELQNLTFGFKIDGENWWTVAVKNDGSYTVSKNKPDEPTFYFTAEMQALEKVHAGMMTGFTAMAKARASDYTPMDFDYMEGYKSDDSFNLLDFIFRYFIIGKIEKIMLGKEYARIVHGGYAIPLVYDKGLRTGWYHIDKGMIINEDPKDQTNPFPTLMVAIKGKGIAKIGGKEFSLSEGEAYYIPKGVTHTFWTNNDDGLECIIIMYGEGA